MKITQVRSTSLLCDGCSKLFSDIKIDLPRMNIYFCNRCFDELHEIPDEAREELAKIVQANEHINNALFQGMDGEATPLQVASLIQSCHDEIDKAIGKLKVIDKGKEWTTS